MKLLMFKKDLVKRFGLLDDGKVVDVREAAENIGLEGSEALSDLLTYIEAGEQGQYLLNQVVSQMEKAGACTYSLEEVTVCAPVKRPEKILCMGLNYIDHCRETGMDVPASPITFSKFANAIIGPEESILLPVNSTQVDYEAELAVVIGKEGKKIPEQDAMNYVFGYMNMNDVSARDLQFQDGQWTRGKAADTFAPVGPYLVTKDDVPDPHHLNIRLFINGEVFQESNTENLIFNIPYYISFISKSMTLKPGDIIATGTPPGVGMSREPQVWLKDGDVVSVETEGLGKLTNSVVQDK